MHLVSALGEACMVVCSDHPRIAKAVELADASTVPHIKLLRECSVCLMPFLWLSLS